MRLFVRPLLLALASTLAGSVHAASSTVALSVSPSPARFGESVTLTATVTPAAATGAVTFYRGVTVLGSAPLSSGTATLRLLTLECGAQALTAYYGGDTNNTASRSTAIPVTVNSVLAKGFLVAPQPSLPQAGLQFPALAIGDFNGDGKLDVAATGAVPSATSLAILLGKGDGTFTAGQVYPGTSRGISMVAADFNRDGKTDLAYLDETAANVFVRLGNGDGSFQPPITSAAFGNLLIAADFNGDGIVDLATTVGSFANGGIRVLLGRGDGSFGAPATMPVADGAGAIAAADFNGDGIPDLVVQEGAGKVQVYTGKGDGTFSAHGGPIVFAKVVGGLAAVDFNGDGRMDLAISSGSTVSLALGYGDGTFAAPKSFPVGRSTGKLAIADVNGDGKLDVVASTGFPDPDPTVQIYGSFAVLDGDGASGMTPDPFHDGITGTYPFAVADFNGDGRVDMVEGLSTPQVYLGMTPTDLSVSLTHSGNLFQGQKDAVLTATVRNLGPGATAADVTLDFTMPDGLSITKFVAAGWQCFGTRCRRTDFLAGGAAFPPVSLTLSVSPIAAPTLLPVAKVSLADMSDPEPSNDAAGDSIKVTQYQTIVFGTLPDLVLGAAPFFLGAAATSGLPVIYTASGNCAVNEGVVNLNGAGACSIRASQAGNDIYLAAPDVIRTFTIGAAATSVTVAATPQSATFGAAVTLTAAISPASAEGRVAFYDGTALLGDVDVHQGTAKLAVSSIPTGVRRIRARYLGAPPWPGSTSAEVSLPVTAAPAFSFSTTTAQADTLITDIAAGDFNGDGLPDVLIGGYNLVVFPGDGKGGLGAGVSTSMTPYLQPITHVAVGDFNGDGKLDVAATAGGPSQTVGAVIWLGHGDGTFTQGPTLTVAGVSVVAADFNGDGLTDLAIGHTSPLAVSVLLSKGDGTFEAPIEYPISGSGPALMLAAADFNQDGAADLAAVAGAPYDSSSRARTRVNLLIGRGDGTFLRPAGWIDDGDINDDPAVAIAAGDLNGDGIPDLVLQDNFRYGPYRCSITTLVSNGDGTFQSPGHWLCSNTSQVSAAGRAAGLAIADFTGDGKADIAALYTYNDGYLHLFAGNGDGTFQSASVYNNFLSVLGQQGLADFDRDGKVDLAAASTAAIGLLLGRPGPALRISLTHSGMMRPGQDVTFMIAVANAPGAAATSGTVTVATTLYAGASSIGGPGWNCSAGNCKRSDTLGGGAAFPPITALLHTDFVIGDKETEVATVSGGGSPPAEAVDTIPSTQSTGLITSVNTVGGSPNTPSVSPNGWVEIRGVNLVPATTPASGVTWSNAPDFASGRMPTELGAVSVTINDKPAYVYFYCSAATSKVCATDQINVLLPPDLAAGWRSIALKDTSGRQVTYSIYVNEASPAILRFGATRYAAATHADYNLIGPAGLYPGASTPARRAETVVVWAVGFGLPTSPLTAGSASQSGTLPEKLTCTVGARPAAASGALVSPGLYQINLTIPPDAPPGDNSLTCMYGSFATVDGATLAVQ
jgi:uncharacterized protein (TIGR03437 family)